MLKSYVFESDFKVTREHNGQSLFIKDVAVFYNLKFVLELSLK